MTTDPLADAVSSQYERWVYPEPILDLHIWLEDNWQWADPSHSHRLFWPDRETVTDLDILVAGCGTSQAAILAYTNPTARVTGIDVSQPSLDHHRRLKNSHALENLDLHVLPIEDVAMLDRDFDLVISTGVLHHLADPVAGLAALAACLRVDGVASLMLYARYGRIGVEMLQDLFREFGLEQDESSVQMVKEAIATLPADHPVQSYLAIAPDLQFDAGLVDTFLHGRDRSYTTTECIELITSAGLVFDDWLLKAPYAVPTPTDNAFLAALAERPRAQQWSIMERIHPRNGCHFVNACRPERPPATYRIDLAAPTAVDYVPFLRHRCTLTSTAIARPDWGTRINATEYSLLRLVDGRLSIGQIVAEGSIGSDLAGRSQADRLAYARTLFETLRQRDIVAMGLPTS